MMEKSHDRMQWMFRREALASRCCSRLAGDAIRRYGLAGPLISGIVCDAWPEGVKRRLRRLCRAQNRYYGAGVASKPRGMHLRTTLRYRDKVRYRIEPTAGEADAFAIGPSSR